MKKRLEWMLAAALVACAPGALAQQLAAGDLADLTLEQLSNIVVTSVSGRPAPVSRSLASVYVITAEDIRRSGATTIMEALRLAPNLEIAQTGNRGYAITARGFLTTTANKLLVLMDGRSLYTPTFSGVFWDAQDTLIEDIDRIEVISGPGGVLWGANAVNGVINIVTKPADDTRGNLGVAGAGGREADLAARHGGALEGGAYRVYAKSQRWDNSRTASGTELRDGADRLQGGFRSDWGAGADRFTLQGDVYQVEGNQATPQDLRGANVLGRWSRDFSGDRLRLQAYWDHSTRQQQELDTYDLDAALDFKARGRHRFLAGGGYRQARDRIENSAALAFFPEDRNLDSWNLYLQDEIALAAALDATLGVRLDRNTYTGVEVLPSARAGWRPGRNELVWIAASRAVRTPSRFDRDLFLPGAPPFLLAGGPNFESEVAWVYELGYRAQPHERISWSATGFYHDLEKVRSIAPGANGATVENDREGNTKGIETWGVLQLADWWRLYAGYTRLKTSLRVREGAVDLLPQTSIGNDPTEWWQLRSAFELGAALELDLMLRHASSIASLNVPAYLATDLRLGWRVSRQVELSLLVRNLLDPGHVEWAPGAELERGAFFKATVRF